MAYDNSKRIPNSDAARSFEDDLEKARALSLESLALEKFRFQKLELEKNKSKESRPDAANKEKKPPREEDRSETKRGSIDIKPRPRPGSFNTGAPIQARILAPPPPVQARRFSAATSGPSTSSDLISFNSPSPSDKTTFEDLKNVKSALENTKILSVTSQSPNVAVALFNPFPESPQPVIPPRPNIPLAPCLQTSFSTTTISTFHNHSTWSNTSQCQTITLRNQGLPPSCEQPIAAPRRRSEPKRPLAYIEDPSFDVMKLISKQNDSNLIDLNPSGTSSVPVRVSVLEAFDPLMMAEMAAADRGDDEASQCSSIYDVYDPFDYMNAPKKESSTVEPLYATVVKKKAAETVTDGTAAPPLPPRCAPSSRESRLLAEKMMPRKTKLFENISLLHSRNESYDMELQHFHDMVKKLREEFPYTDACTNVGLVISPAIASSYSVGTSIKLMVICLDRQTPATISFTCDVSSSIEHVILHVVCEVDGDLKGHVTDYVLKVSGLAEYFSSSSTLADYDYVHQCIKFDQDITLELMKLDDVRRPLLRTPQDDTNDQSLKLEDLLPNEPVRPITYDNMAILLETLERELDRLQSIVNNSVDTKCDTSIAVHCKSVYQAVKAVCTLLGEVETLQITESLIILRSSCLQIGSDVGLDDCPTIFKPEIVRDDGNFSEVTIRRKIDISSSREQILSSFDKIRHAVSNLIEAYCRAFRVAFQVEPRSRHIPQGMKEIQDVSELFYVRVGALHRLSNLWHYEDYQISVQVYHGPRPICHDELFSSPVKPERSLFERIVFDCWLVAHSLPISMLPRESRLVLVLYGRKFLPAENNEEVPKMQREELGWTAIQLFNCKGLLAQGFYLLSLWPPGADKRLGPAPAPGTHPQGDVHPVFGIELPDLDSEVRFPDEIEESSTQMLDFSSLDDGTQEQLIIISEQDTFTNPPVAEREILWEKRHYLHERAEALPKVLLAAHSWDVNSLPDLYSMLRHWSRMEPVNALTLLLPCFPDTEVRKVALGWIRHIDCDELVDYLPQLVQALKHETWEASSLAHFLLERALSSPRVAHHLYWLLTQVLPGSSPQNSVEDVSLDETDVFQFRYHRRLQLMLRALLAISGEAMRQRFMSQQLLVKGLGEVAENVKGCKESLRMSVLNQGLEIVHQALRDETTCLPLSPSLEVGGIHMASCSYYHSNTLPLKLYFVSSETNGPFIPAIFKVGDDLQQDMLTIQMIQIMNKLWIKEGLDLKMVTFACVPTGHKRGMIEMVTNAETLRKIQVELGLTGSFKDRPIAEWLAKHNPSALEYQRAVQNFTASCAGYCVATYVLGIGDRHNDNIMLKTSGHMFHIDFGKFLGDAQMFGNFKRDRTPFVLTSDMAYVINAGDKPSAKFHHFVDLCCQAFNIVRRNHNLILNLFGLMASSGIPGVTMNAVKYVQRALLPDHSNIEAAAMFSRMIELSLRSWFTQFNFFLHNLAQLQFSGSHSEGALLSFIPSVYTMQRDGRIHQVTVYGIQKRYDPEKMYLYIIKVERSGQPDPSYLFRSYREFCELYEKLCLHFPLAKLHSLPTGIYVGRSNTKQVAEKRKVEIELFLRSVFVMADEIAHSDLVYTFFHPILRDQQEANIHARKVKDTSSRGQAAREGRVLGQLKLSLQYRRDALLVMVYHARALPPVYGQEPSTYVKVYLRPDPTKATKRKTKVVRRSCHPSFMEMLEYRLPLYVVKQRQLEATVWSRDPLQENEFLGGVLIKLEDVPLNDESSPEWHSLVNTPRLY